MMKEMAANKFYQRAFIAGKWPKRFGGKSEFVGGVGGALVMVMGYLIAYN